MFSSKGVNWFRRKHILNFSIPLSSSRVVSASAPRAAVPAPLLALPHLDQQSQRGEARNDGPEAGPVGPDGRRGRARVESGPAGYEAAKEGGGEAEVRWDSPASSFSSIFTHIRRHLGYRVIWEELIRRDDICLWAEMTRYSGVQLAQLTKTLYIVNVSGSNLPFTSSYTFATLR